MRMKHSFTARETYCPRAWHFCWNGGRIIWKHASLMASMWVRAMQSHHNLTWWFSRLVAKNRMNREEHEKQMTKYERTQHGWGTGMFIWIFFVHLSYCSFTIALFKNHSTSFALSAANGCCSFNFSDVLYPHLFSFPASPFLSILVIPRVIFCHRNTFIYTLRFNLSKWSPEFASKAIFKLRLNYINLLLLWLLTC